MRISDWSSDVCSSDLLIFVSVAEHYVEILADQAINEKVAQEEWDSIVAAFVAAVKQGRVAEGFEQAVDACGALLAQHFPAAPGERNELPDRLIEISLWRARHASRKRQRPSSPAPSPTTHHKSYLATSHRDRNSAAE